MARYQVPRPAMASREKERRERGETPTPPTAPFKLHSGAIHYFEDKDGEYTVNTRFTKPIHRTMKSYGGDKGKT